MTRRFFFRSYGVVWFDIGFTSKKLFQESFVRKRNTGWRRSAMTILLILWLSRVGSDRFIKLAKLVLRKIKTRVYLDLSGLPVQGRLDFSFILMGKGCFENGAACPFVWRSWWLSQQNKSAELPGVRVAQSSFMKLSSNPMSVRAPETAPAAKPSSVVDRIFTDKS